MKYFVISDTHFGHENIIKYCNRPFPSIEEMDKALIKNWNETISNSDTVIHLGDVGFGSKEYIKDIISQLNGKKILIKGNHDNYSDDFYREAGFTYVSKFPIIWGGTPENNGFYMMSHAPLLLSETTPYFNFYGHVHNDSKYLDNPTSKCVSVERIGYRPYMFMQKN